MSGPLAFGRGAGAERVTIYIYIHTHTHTHIHARKCTQKSVSPPEGDDGYVCFWKIQDATKQICRVPFSAVVCRSKGSLRNLPEQKACDHRYLWPFWRTNRLVLPPPHFDLGNQEVEESL